MIVSNNTRPAQPVAAPALAMCMCATGSTCTSYATGHALHLIQARLASATPTEWVDAIVESVDPVERTVVVREVENGLTRTLFNGAGAGNIATVGDPVAVHARYRVLAIGRTLFNVADIG